LLKIYLDFLNVSVVHSCTYLLDFEYGTWSFICA